MPFPFILLWPRQCRVHDLADLNNSDAVSTGLRALPSELLLMIARQLPLSDAANFALVDHRLSLLIGPTSWPRLRKNALARGNFLSTLTRDLPSWFFCHSCSRLHPRDRIRPPGPFNQPSKPLMCFEDNLEDQLSQFVHFPGTLTFYTFNFHHLQLVMLRHYHGPSYGISTKQLSLMQVSELDELEPGVRMTTLTSVEARVCPQPARLCLRIQTWAVMHTKVLDLALERSKCLCVCRHLVAEEDELSGLIESSLDEYSTRSEKPREASQHMCHHCNFIFQLQVLDIVSNGLAIVITKWLDLGSGLTPMDPKWRILADTFQGGDQEQGQASQAQKCRMDFENEDGMMQQALTLRNASYLNDQRYKGTMWKRCCGDWILQADEHTHLHHWLGILLLSLGLLALMLCEVIGGMSSYKI